MLFVQCRYMSVLASKGTQLQLNFFGSPALLSVRAGCLRFRIRSNAPPLFAHHGRHPCFRAECSSKDAGYIHIGVNVRPMQAEAGRRDFNVGELARGSVRQILDQMHGDSKFDAVMEAHDQPVLALWS